MLTIGNFTERLMRLAWFFPLFLLYSSYYWQAGGPAFLRFFICVFPLIVGSAFMLFEQIKPVSLFWRGVDVGPLLHGVAVVFLVLLVLVPQYQASQAQMRGMVSNGKSQTRLAAGRMLVQTFGDDVVVFSQSPYEAYLDTVRNFRFYHLVRFSGPWNAPIGHGFLHRNGSIGAYPGNVPFVESGGFFEGPQRRWDGTSCSRPLDTSAIDFDLGGDDTYFLSFAIRRAPGVYDPVGLVGLRDGPSGPGISIGFRNGNWQLEGDLGSASGGTATASKTWFVVARVTATSQSTDQIHMKTYDTAQDLVHASETLLNGEGPGTDQWTLISSGGTSSSVLSHLRLDTHSGTIGSTTVPIQIDEIRLGRSWADVTGL